MVVRFDLMPACAVVGCEKVAITRKRGLCNMHNARVVRGHDVGGVESTAPERFPTVASALAALVIRGDSCFAWLGRKAPEGYGVFSVAGKRHYAHRAAFEEEFGLVPPGLFVCHRCDNPECSKPSHLFLGTNEDNIADMVEKRRHVFGSRDGNSKLTEADVLAIRAASDSTTQIELARTFGVTRQTIRRVVRRESWVHLAG